MCGPFLRAGKVSIEEILEACVHKSLIMRTRPRLSGYAAKCVSKARSASLHVIFSSFPKKTLAFSKVLHYNT
jgi:hypothetical protein